MLGFECGECTGSAPGPPSPVPATSSPFLEPPSPGLLPFPSPPLPESPLPVSQPAQSCTGCPVGTAKCGSGPSEFWLCGVGDSSGTCCTGCDAETLCIFLSWDYACGDCSPEQTLLTHHTAPHSPVAVITASPTRKPVPVPISVPTLEPESAPMLVTSTETPSSLPVPALLPVAKPTPVPSPVPAPVPVDEPSPLQILEPTPAPSKQVLDCGKGFSQSDLCQALNSGWACGECRTGCNPEGPRCDNVHKNDAYWMCSNVGDDHCVDFSSVNTRLNEDWTCGHCHANTESKKPTAKPSRRPTKKPDRSASPTRVPVSNTNDDGGRVNNNDRVTRSEPPTRAPDRNTNDENSISSTSDRDSSDRDCDGFRDGIDCVDSNNNKKKTGNNNLNKNVNSNNKKKNQAPDRSGSSNSNNKNDQGGNSGGDDRNPDDKKNEAGGDRSTDNSKNQDRGSSGTGDREGTGGNGENGEIMNGGRDSNAQNGGGDRGVNTRESGRILSDDSCFSAFAHCHQDGVNSLCLGPTDVGSEANTWSWSNVVVPNSPKMECVVFAATVGCDKTDRGNQIGIVQIELAVGHVFASVDSGYVISELLAYTGEQPFRLLEGQKKRKLLDFPSIERFAHRPKSAMMQVDAKSLVPGNYIIVQLVACHVQQL
jgi:hypothetical protein